MFPIGFYTSWKHGFCAFSFLLLAITAALSFGQAKAATTIDDPMAAVEMLLRKLEERDAVIRDLQRRVVELERRVGVPPVEQASVAQEQGAHQPEALAKAMPEEEQSGPTASEGPAPPDTFQMKAAPRQIKVDEQATARAKAEPEEMQPASSASERPAPPNTALMKAAPEQVKVDEKATAQTRVVSEEKRPAPAGSERPVTSDAAQIKAAIGKFEVNEKAAAQAKSVSIESQPAAVASERPAPQVTTQVKTTPGQFEVDEKADTNAKVMPEEEQPAAATSDRPALTETAQVKATPGQYEVDKEASTRAKAVPEEGQPAINRPAPTETAQVKATPGQYEVDEEASARAKAVPEEGQPPASDRSPPPKTAQVKAAPGQFEVDEEAADRALERTLVQQGVLLVPAGKAEVQPSFLYTRNESDFPIANDPVTGEVRLGRRTVRTDRLTGDFGMRFGLPFDSQFEFRLPYESLDSSLKNERVTVDGNILPSETDDNRSGFGDIRLGLAKTLLREQGVWPDLIGRVTWNTKSGQKKDFGDGFHQLRLAFSALKRQDPLAFSGTVSYEKAFENDGIEPGDRLGLNISASLASSPRTSLVFALNQTFIDDFKIDGRTIDGSDRVIGNLSFGTSSIVGRRTLLTFTANMGLTDDAPDYSFGVSLSRRFDIGGFLKRRARPGYERLKIRE